MNPNQYEMSISNFFNWIGFQNTCLIISVIAIVLYFLAVLSKNSSQNKKLNKLERNVFLSTSSVFLLINIAFYLVLNQTKIIKNNESYVNQILLQKNVKYSVTWYSNKSNIWAYKVHTYSTCYTPEEYSTTVREAVSQGVEKITYKKEKKSYQCNFKLVEELSCSPDLPINYCTNKVVDYLVNKGSNNISSNNEYKTIYFTLASK